MIIEETEKHLHLKCTESEMDEYIQKLEEAHIYVEQYTVYPYMRRIYTPASEEVLNMIPAIPDGAFDDIDKIVVTESEE